MAKLAAKHRFILAVIFMVLSFGIIIGTYFLPISEALTEFIKGVSTAGIIIILQFYFRTSSDAEKKEAEIKTGGTDART